MFRPGPIPESATAFEIKGGSELLTFCFQSLIFQMQHRNFSASRPLDPPLLWAGAGQPFHNPFEAVFDLTGYDTTIQIHM